MTGSFLSRWSRRKQKARTAPTPAVVEAAAEPDDAVQERAEPPSPPPDLPPIESLGKDSDYSAFLQPGVPAEQRQQALSRLWATDPTLMAPEVMDLHMQDYSSPPVAEVVKTAWRLGKGVLDAAQLAAEQEDAKTAASPKATEPKC